MWLIIPVLFVGGITGYLLRNIKRINPVAEKLTSWLIYILLFFMGLGIGIKPEIVKNLEVLGIKAMLICLFTILGSVVFAFLFRKKIIKNEE